MEGQPGRARLRFDQGSSHRVHRDTIERRIGGRQQRGSGTGMVLIEPV
jgi:hypothetical protein